MKLGGKWDLHPCPLCIAHGSHHLPMLQVSMEGWGSPPQSKEVLGTWVGFRAWLGGARFSCHVLVDTSYTADGLGHLWGGTLVM